MRKLLLLFAVCLFSISSIIANNDPVIVVNKEGIFIINTELSCKGVIETAKAANVAQENPVFVAQSGAMNNIISGKKSDNGSRINGISIPALSGEKALQKAIKQGGGEGKAGMPLLLFKGKKGLQLIGVSPKSDKKGLMRAFMSQSCTTDNAMMIFVYPENIQKVKGNEKVRAININGKPVTMITGVVTTSLYGEILISGEPIEFEE